MVHIVGITGSLRKASTNTGLLRAIAKLLPADHTMDIIVPDIPLYNGDIEAAGIPASVKEFRQRVKRGEAVLFASPEYNYAITGPLKNAIDWGSRGDSDGNLWNDKAAAVVSTGGQTGGLKSTLHVADTAVGVNLHLLNHPQFPLNFFANPHLFDKDGNLIDQKTIASFQKFVDAFVLWNHRISSTRK